MRLTNDVKNIIKQRINTIYDKKLEEYSKNIKTTQDIRSLFRSELNKTFKANLSNRLKSFEKKYGITFVNKEEIIKNISIEMGWNSLYRTEETEKFNKLREELCQKSKLAYEDLIVKLTLNKDINTFEEELQKIEQSLQ